MKTINKSISNKITHINFVLSIFIVMLHSACISSLNKETIGYRLNYCIQKSLLILADASVPLFFMISAFLLFSDYNIRDYKNILKKRIKTILIPYFLWSGLGWGIYAFATHVKFLKKIVNSEAVSLNLRDIIRAILFADYNPPIWFLRTLFAFIILSPATYALIKKAKGYTVGIACVSAFLNCILIKPTYSGVVFWLPVHLIAAWYGSDKGKLCEPISSKKATKYMLILCFIVIGICFLEIDTNDNLYYIYRMISPVLLWKGLDCFRSFSQKPIAPQYNLSFFIFCVHIFFVIVLKKIYINVLGHSNSGVTFSFALIVITTIALVVCVSYVIRRKCPKLYFMLTGSR